MMRNWKKMYAKYKMNLIDSEDEFVNEIKKTFEMFLKDDNKEAILDLIITMIKHDYLMLLIKARPDI